MRAKSIMRAFSIGLTAAGFVTGCDKTPTTPTSRAGQDPPARVQVVLNVEVVGPQVVTLGQSEQFRLMARLNDGSSLDVTDQALWRWLPDNRLPMSMPGLVTGIERGDFRVTANWDGYHGEKVVTVLPAGTFKLMGTVIEAEVPSGPVHSALVEVTTGVGARLTAQTDDVGTYRLYGVSGEIGIRVSKDGYQPAERSTVVSDHGTTYDIELPLVMPRQDVSGVYTLTIKAAEGCRLGLGEGSVPEEARVRTYQADVRQNGPSVEVTLSGATLRRPVFFGRVEPGRVVFDLREYDVHDSVQYFIMEQLPTSRFLGIFGSVSAVVSANHLGGPFHGGFYIFDTESNRSREIALCGSESHQFVLSR